MAHPFSLAARCAAALALAGSVKVPMISLAGGGAIVVPQDGPRKWAFKLSPTEPISVNLVLDHLLRQKGKSIALIAFATSYGEGFVKTIEALAAQKGIKVLATERYNPSDQSVTAQVVKVMATGPDAVYILGSGTPGAPEFRAARRNALEGLKDHVGSQAVFTMSAADHNGVDSRSQVMVRIEGGTWKLQP